MYGKGVLGDDQRQDGKRPGVPGTFRDLPKLVGYTDLFTSLLSSTKLTTNMDARELQKALDKMRGYIRRDVAAGFRSEDEIRTGVVELLADGYEPSELEPYAKQMAHEEMESHFREELTWPEVTDCDRLDAAFTDLEHSGIVARQDFSCCGNCGSGEIWDEMETASKRGLRVRGYIFYHMQDTEAATEGRGVYLNYGAVQEGETAALEIAKEVVATIQRHGLAVEWDGTWQKRIGVQLDWKRRRQR